MSMTKKDYELIARAVTRCRPDDGSGQWAKDEIITYLCATFQADNPNFQPARFVAACHQQPQPKE